MANESKAQRYAKESESLIRKNKNGIITLGIEPLLYLSNDEDPPLKIHSGFSRMKFSLINKTADTTYSVYGNIPAKEIQSIKTKTDAAITCMTWLKLNPQNTTNADTTNVQNDTSSPAYTVQIANGNLRGKTPAQVLIENPSNKTALENQRKWLETNLNKYPKNKEQIDAIDDALSLLAQNKLINSPISTNTSIIPSIDIYRANIRIPNAKQVDKNGNTFVYSINITCDPNKNYPFSINITNMMAKPSIDNNGLVTASLATATDKKVCTISLTDSEWINIVNSLHHKVESFERLHFPNQWKKSETLYNAYKNE